MFLTAKTQAPIQSANLFNSQADGSLKLFLKKDKKEPLEI